MAHFPMFRLATLLARQMSSPFASFIKEYARTHPRFSRSVCMATGRAFHEFELRFRMWTLALKQPRNLPPISDQTALSTGADILGEVVVFALGGLIVVFEVNRQANKQEDKVLDEASEWLAVLVSLEELQRELVLQQQDMDRLQGKLRDLAPQYFPASPLPAVPTPPAPPSASPPAPSVLDEECEDTESMAAGAPPALPPSVADDSC